VIADRIDERYDDVSTLDGVRVDADDGWFLIRASGTQPLIRITAEARDRERADELFEQAHETVSSAAEIGDP
jgi:phosphoglucosamine mutase